MHIRFVGLVAATSVLIAASAAAFVQVASHYSELEGKSCVTRVDDASTGARTSDCAGIQGYRVRILEDDERTSVNILTPDGRQFPLRFWDVVTRGFSSLSGKAEWRVRGERRKAVPVALIIRVDTLDQTAVEHPRRVQFLVVSKITRDTACVTHRVDASARGALLLARELADSSEAACLIDRPELNQRRKG